MPVSYQELVQTYDQYTSLCLELAHLRKAGLTGEPLYAAIKRELESAWTFYSANGGWEVSLHDGAAPLGPDRVPDARPVLTRGTENPSVAELQSLLGIATSGVFDRLTEESVRDFQASMAMKPDGVVGPKTWRALLNPYTPAGHIPQQQPRHVPEAHNICLDGDNAIALPADTARWGQPTAFCGDMVQIVGGAHRLNGEKVQIEVLDTAKGSAADAVEADVVADAFVSSWKVRDVLPVKEGGHYKERATCALVVDGQKFPNFLAVRMIVNLPRKNYAAGHAHFHLEVKDSVLVIGSTVEFVQGWAASVVKLGAAVAADIGGLLDGQLAWDGYRWMRDSGVRKEFWNGAAWVRLPPGFRLTDANNFCVGFYKHAAGYTCQYGGIWPTPGNFAEWNINDVLNRQKISAWENNIGSTWSRKFFIKRKSCPSRDVACCRFSTEAAVSFQRNDAFREGLLIIAAGNIRSNDSLFFLGEDRLAMAAHEFGHHLGNPDEYAGASVEVALNGDGAVNGIDTDSIMGQNLTKVKRRHCRTICKHLASMVKDEKGRDFEYEAIAT